jgi:hypothetical protein
MSPASVPGGLDLFAVSFASAVVTDTPGGDLKSGGVVGPGLIESEAFQRFENTVPNEENEAGTVLEAGDRCSRVAQSDCLARDWCCRGATCNDEFAEEPDPGEFPPGNPADFVLPSERVHHGMVRR